MGQFKDPLIYVLLVSAIIVNFLGEFTDGIIIVVVLVINSLIGTIQELKARKTLDSLKEFTKGMAIVVRGGREFEIEDTELTPGDLIIIRDGYKIPSDARLVIVQNLRINESALTGESTPVEKILGIFDKKTPIPERKNMVYKGTFCVSGQGKTIIS